MIPYPEWPFSSRIAPERRLALQAASNFDQVIQRITSEAVVTSFDVKRGKEGTFKNCVRPQFEIAVSQDAADLFFNSPRGYRAQYLVSPEEGQKQNGRLLAALEESLLSFASGKVTKNHLSLDHIRAAIRACSAKIWLSEADLKFNHELVEDISIPVWRANAVAALAAYARNERPEPECQEKAIWGLRAPQTAVLDIKGAFLDGEHNEVVPYQKICRRHQIHEYGFT